MDYKEFEEVCGSSSLQKKKKCNNDWIFSKGTVLIARLQMSKCRREIVIGPFVASPRLWCVCNCKAVDSREYATPGLMNKMRSLRRIKVQQEGSKFSTSLSATNWLRLVISPRRSRHTSLQLPVFFFPSLLPVTARSQQLTPIYRRNGYNRSTEHISPHAVFYRRTGTYNACEIIL